LPFTKKASGTLAKMSWENPMEIVGLGTDIVECVRIRKMIEDHGELFLQRVYTDKEIRYCQSRRQAAEHFAGRWAAKEAVLKALGTGWRRGISWRDVEIRNDPSGQPKVAVRGEAKEIARRMRLQDILITISHCRQFATAYAVAVRPDRPKKRKAR
jgi:holo-[acyl-carrier protein] synthase